MGYTLLQIGDILLKADRTMYRIGSIAYDDMFNALDEALDYNRDIIYIYKKAVEYADDFYVGTEKLDTVVEKLGQKVAAYDFGKLTPIYSDATVITGVVPSGAALNDLSDVTITNVQDNQILKYNSALGQWVNVGSGAAVRNRQQFTATLNQTVFVTSFPFSSSLLDVYLNGVKLSPPSYTTFGNYTITLADGSISDDIVEVIAYDGDTSFIDLSGYVPISRTLTINGVTYDLSTNRSWTVTGGVPYTGATGDVNLGEFGLSAGQLTLDTSPTGTAAVGTTRWNDTIGSSETTLKGGSVILKNGVDLVARVVNKVSPNTTLTKAAYQAVRVSGAQGQRLAVALAQANNDANSADTIGLVTETIATNQEGFIMTVGQLENINTTGSLQGETWADGDVLYLSPTTAGAITKVKPTGNGHIVVIGYVEYAHANNGKIYVKVMNGWELTELHDCDIVTPANNEALIYESSTSLWKNKTIASALGYTPISGSGATGQVAYWNGTNSQTGSNNLFWDAANSRLGIGTNAPTSPLFLYTNTSSTTVADNSGFILHNNNPSQTVGNLTELFFSDAGQGTGTANGLNLLHRYAGISGFITGWNFTNSSGGLNFVTRATNGGSLTTKLQIRPSGNVLIQDGGTFTDGGQRLQVYGDAFVRGSGNTSATTALLVQNSASATLFSVNNVGITTINGNAVINSANNSNGLSINFGTGSFVFNVNSSSSYTGTFSITNTGFFIGHNASSRSLVLQTNNTDRFTLGGSGGATISTNLQVDIGFVPTSGTALFTQSLLTGTINQTGGANGITRGLYVNPTLTAAADWRSIEWSNNSGWGLYGAGTAPNFLGGNLTISRNQDNFTFVELYNTTSATNSAVSFGLTSDAASGQGGIGKYSTLKTAYKIIASKDLYFSNNFIGGDIAILNDFASGRIKFAAGGSSTAQMTLTAAGRLLLGTVSEGTDILRVQGTSLLNGNVTFSSATAMFWDAANSRLGIGTATPLDVLDIRKNQVTTNAATTTSVLLSNTNASGIAAYAFTSDGTTRQGGLQYNNSTGFRNLFSCTYTDIPHYFGTNNLIRLTITGSTGNILVNTTTDISSSIFTIESTTKGFLPPRMTTTQKNAIASPTAGLMVFDTTLVKLCVHNGTTWETITSV